MNKKQIIFLGLGAVALYFYFRNKPKANAITPKVEPIQPISPLPNLVVPKPTPLPSIKPKPSISTKYDCNWVKQDVIRRGTALKRMKGKGVGYYPYFLILSDEEKKAYEKCGIEIPA